MTRVEIILEAVSSATGVPVSLITKPGGRGKRRVSDARHMAMAIMCRHTFMTLTEVANACGISHHASVIQAKVTVETNCGVDAGYRADFRRALSDASRRIAAINPPQS